MTSAVSSIVPEEAEGLNLTPLCSGSTPDVATTIVRKSTMTRRPRRRTAKWVTAVAVANAYNCCMSMLILVALVPLILLGVFSLRAANGSYPDEFELGGIIVRFSAIDRISYLIAIVAIVVGVVAGLASIWLPRGAIFGRLAASGGLLFVGSLLTLFLNRLMRGRRP